MQNTNEDTSKSMEMFLELETICIELRKRKQHLNSELSIVDKKRTDIEHYIEFYSLSASKGYKASKMLKECLEERRKIKNEMALIDNTLRMNIAVIGNGKGRNMLEKTKDKQYRPRVLEELFDS